MSQTKVNLQLEHLRKDPQFHVLMTNLYTQASSVNQFPMGTPEEKLNKFKEIAELDLTIYLLSSGQVEWNGEQLKVEETKEADISPTP